MQGVTKREEDDEWHNKTSNHPSIASECSCSSYHGHNFTWCHSQKHIEDGGGGEHTRPLPGLGGAKLIRDEPSPSIQKLCAKQEATILGHWG